MVPVRLPVNIQRVPLRNSGMLDAMRGPDLRAKCLPWRHRSKWRMSIKLRDQPSKGCTAIQLTRRGMAVEAEWEGCFSMRDHKHALFVVPAHMPTGVTTTPPRLAIGDPLMANTRDALPQFLGRTAAAVSPGRRAIQSRQLVGSCCSQRQR